MNILDLVVGKPIKTSDERAEQIGPAQGVPIFGLDALSSAAYGPEAALSLLIPLGLLGVRYILPVAAPTPWRASTSARLPACLPRPRSSPITSSLPPWAFPREWVPWSRLFRPCCRTRFLFASAFLSSSLSSISAVCAMPAWPLRFPPISLSAHFSLPSWRAFSALSSAAGIQRRQLPFRLLR